MELHRGDKEAERGKEIVALDASVVIKWFVDEKHIGVALRARDDYLAGKSYQITVRSGS